MDDTCCCGTHFVVGPNAESRLEGVEGSRIEVQEFIGPRAEPVEAAWAIGSNEHAHYPQDTHRERVEFGAARVGIPNRHSSRPYRTVRSRVRPSAAQEITSSATGGFECLAPYWTSLPRRSAEIALA